MWKLLFHCFQSFVEVGLGAVSSAVSLIVAILVEWSVLICLALLTFSATEPVTSAVSADYCLKLYFSLIFKFPVLHRSLTLCWVTAVGTIICFVSTQNLGLSTQKLSLTVRPVAPTYWRFSQKMAKSQLDLGSTNSPTQVRNFKNEWLDSWMGKKVKSFYLDLKLLPVSLK